MDDDEAGGEDPKMNSCNPSHVRLHRSNCDCKVVMNKFGPAMYVTKGAAEYACKMEVASQDYEAIMNKNLRFNNGCFKAPESHFEASYSRISPGIIPAKKQQRWRSS